MNQRGFTLIEVMVVVAIVAVLSAIAVPGYQNYIRKAALIDVLRTVTAFKTGVELCSFDNPSLQDATAGRAPFRLILRGATSNPSKRKTVL